MEEYLPSTVTKMTFKFENKEMLNSYRGF